MRMPITVVFMFTLAACGGGGGTGPTEPDRNARAESIINSANTLLASSTDIHMTVAGESLDVYDTYSCAGTICVSHTTGDATTLEGTLQATGNLLIEEPEATYGTSKGFDTVRSSGGLDIRNLLEGLGFRISAFSDDSVTAFGFWGDHGIASAMTVDATVSGAIGATRFEDLTVMMSQGIVVGNATGSNPSTSATWRGIAQGYDAYGQTGSGTATLTASLSSQPTVDADIRIGGTRIGTSAWSNIPLAGGRFETGSGFNDRIVGHFHGPNHEETYGTFDTHDWSGVFGAKR